MGQDQTQGCMVLLAGVADGLLPNVQGSSAAPAQLLEQHLMGDIQPRMSRAPTPGNLILFSIILKAVILYHFTFADLPPAHKVIFHS